MAENNNALVPIIGTEHVSDEPLAQKVKDLCKVPERDGIGTGMKKTTTQVYDDTRLKVFSPERHMQVGETLIGQLTMVEDYEYFEFRAQEKERWTRNPKVFQGEYINVHRDKNGHYQIHLRKMELTNRSKAVRDGNAIQTELVISAKVLGL